MQKIRVRIAASALAYVVTLGDLEGWTLVRRENIVGFENPKKGLRVREPMFQNEQPGDSWEVEI